MSQMQQKELYLNLQIAKVSPELVRRSVVNDGQAETLWGFEVEGAVIDENTFFGLTLRDSEGYTEDAFFGLARVDIAGTEEDLKAPAKIESFDAVLIQLERLVVDSADKIAVRG